MLHIDPALLLVTVVIFLGLIFVLNHLLYKPVVGFIDSRNSQIAQDEEMAKKNYNDVTTCKAEMEQIINSAKLKANEIIQAAMSEATSDANKQIEAKKAALELDYDVFISDLKTKIDTMKSELRTKIPEFKDDVLVSISKI